MLDIHQELLTVECVVLFFVQKGWYRQCVSCTHGQNHEIHDACNACHDTTIYCQISCGEYVLAVPIISAVSSVVNFVHCVANCSFSVCN